MLLNKVNELLTFPADRTEIGRMISTDIRIPRRDPSFSLIDDKGFFRIGMTTIPYITAPKSGG